MRKRLVLAVITCLALAAINAAPTSAGLGAFTTALRGQAFPQVVVDPNNPKIVYAAGNNTGYVPYVYKGNSGLDKPIIGG